MPGKVKVKIISGRNLPVMDRSSDTTDAYVEIKLGNTSYKTDVCRKTLNPLWNSEWYRFEVDDLELQDEPLQIRLMDHDTYSANDAIGKVYLNLNPLLSPASGLSTKYGWAGESNLKNQASSSIMSGWIPVYDTMHGIRGEVNVTVKVELFTDFNKFRQSSCGVQFFCSSTIPHGFYTQIIHGFVEELVVNDDPEYQWIDKIRTPRASNEARQTLFFKLSGELQRKIGVKTLDLGGNAVIGYNQCFDLEGESGIVARGIGTAVTLIKIQEQHQQLDERIAEEYVTECSPVQTRSQENQPCFSNRRGHNRTDSTGGKVIHSPARLNAIPCIHRRSSDSDLSITPKGNSLTGSDKSANATSSSYQQYRPPLLHSTVDNFDMMEYPFLTISRYPPGFILHLGSAISARSVKLLERITNIEEPESRDTWWSELRMEIRSHAKALNCNAILGYTESTSICDEICVLSASGTAAVINFGNGEQLSGVGLPVITKLNISNKDLMTTSLDRNDFELDKPKITEGTIVNKIPQVKEYVEPKENNHTVNTNPTCSLCHIPYNESNVSFRMTMLNCSICKQCKVPDVLLTTIESPENVPSIGRGCFLQSYVCRPKRDLKGELNAKEISESLPFLEYELHRLLVNKMKVKGMNAIFGLQVRITIGEKFLIGIATGTAVYLLPLPTPTLPKLVAGNATTDEEKILDMQKLLMDTVKKNREIYELKIHMDQDIKPSYIINTIEPEEKKSSSDLNTKDCCVLEIDDSEDIEVLNLLIEPQLPDGFQVVNTEFVPGIEDLELSKNLQMFTQVWRAKITMNQTASQFDKHFKKLLQSVYFKLRRMIPCALCNLEFRIELPEPDEIQLTLLGMALALGDPNKIPKYKRKNICQYSPQDKKIDDDLIFTLEEDIIKENTIPVASQTGLLSTQFVKYRQKSPTRSKLNSKLRYPLKERHGVDITPLSYIPGGRIEKYLGYLNFFFIRETNSIREVSKKGGGLSGFVHSFITEVLAIVRAHVIALGGNAMVGYFMTECVLYHSTHKNQGQLLINVGGDVVFVSYFMDD